MHTDNKSAARTGAFDDFLIAWIHRVETPIGRKARTDSDGPGKRLPGLITEAYFERALGQRLWRGMPTEFSPGWAYRTEFGSDRRSWFKLSDGTSCELNHAFVRQLLACRPADQFFIVRASLNGQLHEGVPAIRFELQRTDGDRGASSRLDQSNAKDLAASIQQEVEKALLARSGLVWDERIAHRFRGFDTHSLQQLLFMRCLMNFGKLYLTDVDAIARTEAGQLEFIEFKRKTPAVGKDAWQVVPTPHGDAAAEFYIKQAEQLGGRFNPLPADFAQLSTSEKKKTMLAANRELNAYLRSSSSWQQATPCLGFGLDLSHVRNVQLADAVGMNYRYIIWNSDLRSPDELFRDDDLVPRHEQTLLSLLVRPQHFDRLTKTVGEDSGTYTGKLRFQLVIPMENFHLVEVQPTAAGPA